MREIAQLIKIAPLHGTRVIWYFCFLDRHMKVGNIYKEGILEKGELI